LGSAFSEEQRPGKMNTRAQACEKKAQEERGGRRAEGGYRKKKEDRLSNIAAATSCYSHGRLREKKTLRKEREEGTRDKREAER